MKSRTRTGSHSRNAFWANVSSRSREPAQALAEELLVALRHVDHLLQHLALDKFNVRWLFNRLQRLKLQIALVHVVVGVPDRDDVRPDGEDEQQEPKQGVELVDVVSG